MKFPPFSPDSGEENLIEFHFENVNFDFPQAHQISQWILDTVGAEGKSISHFQFIFCTDSYLHEINLKYLNHDTFTDIITFPYVHNPLESDIFISIDRIRENANTFGITFEKELYRVIIHGVLHMIGYSDKTQEDKKIMTQKEDQYLNRLNIDFHL